MTKGFVQRRWVKASELAAAFLALSLGFCVAARAEEKPLVTVELFTSQGCASCPPADAFVRELAKRPHVLALSLPVDYWDYLGWRDTLATPGNTQRQYAYAHSLKVRRPYTPQVVIDGRYECVGSDRSDVEFALRRFAKDDKPRVPLAVSTEGEIVTVTAGALPAPQKKKNKKAALPHATVWLLRYVPLRTVPVTKGENEGHTLTYANVVRDLSPLGVWEGSPVSFRLSRTDLKGDGAQFAVLVQQDGTGPILGAVHFSTTP